MHAPRKKNWAERLLKSQYFVIALMIHVVAFLLISTIVVFRAFNPPGDFESPDYLQGTPDGGPPPPPPAASQQTETPPIPTTPSTAPSEILTVDTQTPDSIVMNAPTVIGPTMDFKKNDVTQNIQNSAASATGSLEARAAGIRGMMGAWGGTGKGGPKGTGKDLQAEFVCYVAKYAGGDWNATIRMDGTSVVGGSIPNLLRMINQYSRGRIKANVVPQPLNLSSGEIFEKKPPFIFFNGRKDFKLTDQEIENLRRYLLMGGAIWGDTALAGTGSRFDVAFRREMKRVIPDPDKQFELLPDSHELYNQSFYSLKGPPAGMNYYQQPIEAIKIDGVIAVIYTVNDYGDMMQMAFKPGTKEPDLREGPKKFLVTPKEMWDLRESYYRNFTPEASEEAFHLGTNIVEHLLVRWGKRLELVM